MQERLGRIRNESSKRILKTGRKKHIKYEKGVRILSGTFFSLGKCPKRSKR